VRRISGSAKRSPAPWLAVIVAAGLLAACGLIGGKPTGPICPSINILPDASRVTIFRNGPGRDLSDIAYEARVIGFEGDCVYKAANKEKEKDGKYTDVTLNVRPKFRVVAGPALTGARVALNYFIAMPEFYPNPEGRADFSRDAEIPANRTPIELIDTDIQVTIPLGETRAGASVPVYIGFILTEEQLEQNRRRTGGRLEP
jgi:hypothetical protein